MILIMKRCPISKLSVWFAILTLIHGVLLHKTTHEESIKRKDDSFSDEGDLPTDQHFFIDEIFGKYGDGQVMSFEGFEHLLENLGLGRLEFDKNHNVSVHRVNGTFREVHDILDLHRHDHNTSSASSIISATRLRRGIEKNNHDYDEALEELESNHSVKNESVVLEKPTPRLCLSPQDMLLTFGLEPHHAVVINPLRFLKLCPAIVYELDQRTCYHHEEQATSKQAGSESPNQFSAWLYASLSVLVISLVGLLGVAVVPLVQKTFYKKFLHFLVALAVGTLCGDALLHLLPHALMSSHETSDHITPVLRATAAFLALTFFFFVEAMIKCIVKTDVSKKMSNERRVSERDERRALELGPLLVASPASPHGHQHYDGDGQVGTVAWMVIMGDGLHNLTDGLAIGAAFSSDIVAGFATTMAVFCHELPHEIGDFAVLLNSGMTIRRALFYNIISSVLSFTGMAIGVWIGDHEEAALWIYAVTAGTFLYISLADLIPEMTSKLDASASPFDVLLQISGILSGGGIMLAIALYEDNLRTIFDDY